jgi:hypothetical protein
MRPRRRPKGARGLGGGGAGRGGGSPGLHKPSAETAHTYAGAEGWGYHGPGEPAGRSPCPGALGCAPGLHGVEALLGRPGKGWIGPETGL